MLCSIYEYVYFNLYQWSVKVNGKEYYNNYSASIMLTLILFFNITTLISIGHIISGWKIPNLIEYKIYVLSSAVIIATANYKYFTYKKRYIKIVEHYKTVKNASGSVSLVVGWLVFGSLGLLFLTWFIGLQLR